jgi:O-antigen/teichoic acid export membrane protein
MLNNLLATLFFKVDVTLLEPIRGNREVGWYSAGYKFIDAYNVVPSLFTLSLFPLLSRQAADPNGRRAFGFTYAFAVKLLVTIALPLAIVTTFLAPGLIWLLGGEQFLPEGATALAILAWSIPFGWINSITNYALISVDQKRGLTRAFAISVVFNVVANLLLLPAYGFRAAAALTIASEIFEGLAFYYYVRKSIGPMPWLRILWRPWFSALCMAGVTLALWPLHPALALPAGLLVYGGAVALLRVFRADERATLLSILPSQLRQRFDPSTSAHDKCHGLGMTFVVSGAWASVVSQKWQLHLYNRYRLARHKGHSPLTLE